MVPDARISLVRALLYEAVMEAETSSESALRRAVVEASNRIIALGLSQGTSGNVSVRFGDGFLVTPSGIPAEDLAPDHIVPMDLSGRHDHPLAPS